LILTVTLNPAIDLTFAVDRLAFEDRSYINARGEAAGGRGVNAARVLHAFGGDVLALMPSGGDTAERFENGLSRLGLKFELVPIAQPIRKNFIITDRQGLTVKINERGPRLTQAELDGFEDVVRKRMPSVDWLLLCGSLPPGVSVEFYCRLIRIAKSHGAKTLVDTDGEHLQALLEEGPTAVVPNQSEAEHLLNKALITRNQFVEAVERIQRMGAEMAILSLGNRGAVAYDGVSVYEVTPPVVDAVSPIGAGDALDAAFVWAMTQGNGFSDAVRWGVATGTASAALPGFDFAGLEESRAMYDRVEVRKIR
jgi:1-phosphofructokinase family hexose kinase